MFSNLANYKHEAYAEDTLACLNKLCWVGGCGELRLQSLLIQATDKYANYNFTNSFSFVIAKDSFTNSF